MTESPDRVLEGVREWLERGGYVLELEAARIIARSGVLNLSQGYHYADPVTGKDREGDIYAETFIRSADQVHAMKLVVECKDTTAPWVFFVGDRASSAEPWRAVKNADIWHCTECMALFDRIELRATPGPSAYAVTEKRAKNDKDHAYEAVQQAASALLAAFPEISHDGPHTSLPVFGHAIVVTRSRLVVCTLDDDGTVQLETVPAASVTVPRLNLPLDQSQKQGIQVSVVQVDALEGFITSLTAAPSSEEIEAAAEDLKRWHEDPATDDGEEPAPSETGS